MLGRSGKKRLDLWLSEDHPIFKVNPGERTRVIESLGNLEIAMSLIADMRQEMLDNFSQIKQAIARIEGTIIPGQIHESNNQLLATEQAGEFDINSVYEGFGGLATAQNDDKKRGRGTNMESNRLNDVLTDYASNHYEEIEKIYKQAYQTMLIAWQAVHRGQDELEWSEAISPAERRIDAQAEYDGEILKITINDVLPRKKNDAPASLLRLYWMGNVLQALKKLDVPVHFENALCAIKVYGPRDVGWDVDNRAFSYAINAIRAAGVIPGDEWDKLSLLLLGGLDKKNPRTEIWVRNYPVAAINNLFGSI